MKPSINVHSGKDKDIKALRALLEPSPVKLGRLPRWVPRNFSPQGMLFDHWGTIDRGGPFSCCRESGKCLVSEPYGFGENDAELLNQICQAYGWTWHISGNSWWFPTQTIRIVIHPIRRPLPLPSKPPSKLPPPP